MNKYKKNPSIKTPMFAWMMNNMVVYSLILIVGVLTIGAIIYSSFNFYYKMIQPTEKETPFVTVSSISTPGFKWAEKFISTPPPGVKQWKVMESTVPRHIVKNSYCNVGYDLPEQGVLASFTAEGGGVKVGLQITSPTQSLTSYNKYVKKLDECFETYETVINNVPVFIYDNSFLINRGDTVLNVDTKDNEDLEKYLSYYTKELETSLNKSGCVNLSVDSNDLQRAFYEFPEEYKGLMDETVVEAEIEIDDLPTPTNLTIHSINENRYYLTVPESPLPKKFPSKLPAKPDYPVIPVFQEISEFSEKAVYQVEDVDGPGCGWEWHGQKAPILDKKELKAKEDKTILNVLEKMNEEAKQYVLSNIKWNYNIIKLYPKINEWNKYVKKANKVFDKWEWLEAERNILKPYWYQYIGDLNAWLEFDEVKEKAEKEYDKILKKCEAENEKVKEWEEEYGEYVNDDTERDGETEDEGRDRDDEEEENEDDDRPNRIPPKPEGCERLPDRPAILDQRKPDRPNPPIIPEGVTIPNSWPKEPEIREETPKKKTQDRETEESEESDEREKESRQS